jgi:6-phosphogluconolactonase
MTRIHRFADLETLSRAAARALVEDIQSRLAVQDRYTLALAGGSTPQRLYERLGAEAAGPLPWERLHLFWGDERYVPPTDPRSNHRLVQRTLLADAPCPAANVHPIPTDRTPPETAAAAYEQTLRRFFADRGATFDTVLLGLGADAHTASLFPETPALGQTDDWVRVVEAPPRHDVARRLTCTLPVLNQARQAFVLVAGTSKRATVQAALYDRDASLPITRVRPRDRMVWPLDAAAAPADKSA